MIDSPERIWNADETGFSMGSKASTVVGPTRRGSTSSQVPHASGGSSKQRSTVMLCGCADGRMMPPFYVYPAPKPRGYNPLSGVPEGSSFDYTKKGWMDAIALRAFVQHFDLHCGRERRVVLLIDSISSHVDFQAFQDAKERGTELYRIKANATHVMQPLDKGLFWPLKTRWNQVVRKHSQEHPGLSIGKETFAEKLQEAFLLFYKPPTVINSFRSSGIFPVDSSVITLDHVKPVLTFAVCEEHEGPSSNATTVTQTHSISDENTGAAMALRSLEDALSTPLREKYQKRIQEGYDVVGLSPLFDTYKKRYDKSCMKTTSILDAT
ncbi:jerky protein homolog-like [Haliotis rubra]|uniref:jerky protein homolog-like n=1 Tax=Haliotis rubra TaxID=36100 RepID=UPI001EE5283C|nr:jerky protein homolog-like [Haliotis rubra]